MTNRPEYVASEIVEVGRDDRVPRIDRQVQRRHRLSNVANTLEEVSGPLVFFQESESILFGGGSVVPVEGIERFDGGAGGDNGLPVGERGCIRSGRGVVKAAPAKDFGSEHGVAQLGSL